MLFWSYSILNIYYFLIFILTVLVIVIAWKRKMYELFNRFLRIKSFKQRNLEYNSSELNISENIVCKILKNLAEFERNEKYLCKNIKLQSLAIKLNTNDKYLSKTIKHYYSKKFVDYVNDLRIDYAIKKLKNHKRFRLYSIRTIADEVGFSTSNTFSKAFEKRIGSKPSHFIKRLESTE